MSEAYPKKTVVVCDTQPVTAEGLRTLLSAAGDLEFLASVNSLGAAAQLVTTEPPDVVIIDNGFGMRTVLDWIHDLRREEVWPAVTLWGGSMTEAQAIQSLRAGAKGIVRKTADVESILSCLRTVASGGVWTENWALSNLGQEHNPRSMLTSRQHQVLEMVKKGFKNKEIALELGIRPGTVKIHLKHVFEKTGVHGRRGLEIRGLKERILGFDGD